jgi:hypothetical protein
MQNHSMLATDRDDKTGLRTTKAAVAANIKPASLDMIMQSYIDQLPFKQAMLVQIASVLGMQFERALLFEMASEETGLAAEELILHTQSLLNSGWLREIASSTSCETLQVRKSSKREQQFRHIRRIYVSRGAVG